MDYILENEYLKVTLTTRGAQLKSVVRKCDGVEHMWQADKSVWGYHAPILFPFTGKVKDGMMEARGQHFENLPQHGFARIGEHTPVSHNETSVALELGGETGNWCVVRKDADLRDAARKIAFFKLCNAALILGWLCGIGGLGGESLHLV